MALITSKYIRNQMFIYDSATPGLSTNTAFTARPIHTDGKICSAVSLPCKEMMK